MPSFDELKYTALKNIRAELHQLAKTNDNFLQVFVEYAKMVREDIQSHSFKPIDPKDLKPRFELGTHVVVYSESHVRDGWRGTIQGLGASTAQVELSDGTIVHLGGDEMLPLYEKPLDTNTEGDAGGLESVQEDRRAREEGSGRDREGGDRQADGGGDEPHASSAQG